MDDAEQVLDQFLSDYCPRPDIIRDIALKNWVIGEKKGGQFLLRSHEEATDCWLIIRGRVVISSDGLRITERERGDIIGEQAYLQRALGKPIRTIPQADVLAASENLTFWSINPSFEALLSTDNLRDAREAWHLTLSAVVNKKLGEAITDRAQLRGRLDGKDDWLGRFADGDALDLVRTAAYKGVQQIRLRDAIVWFSDIANFSTWSVGKDPDEIGRIARRLTEIQINKIRESGGLIDKIQGDGLMAIWFIDGPLSHKVPRKAIRCAQEIASLIKNDLNALSLTNSLDIRIGMHCGKVAFGDFGTEGRIAVTVLGDTVNRASRYESAKRTDGPPLGRIRVSPELKDLEGQCSGVETPPVRYTGPIEVEVKHGLVIKMYFASEETQET